MRRAPGTIALACRATRETSQVPSDQPATLNQRLVDDNAIHSPRLATRCAPRPHGSRATLLALRRCRAHTTQISGCANDNGIPNVVQRLVTAHSGAAPGSHLRWHTTKTWDWTCQSSLSLYSLSLGFAHRGCHSHSGLAATCINTEVSCGRRTYLDPDVAGASDALSSAFCLASTELDASAPSRAIVPSFSTLVCLPTHVCKLLILGKRR